MTEHNDLYRDPDLASAWEQGMRSIVVRNDTQLYNSVVAWSRSLRAVRADPIKYRLAILNLMGAPRPVTDHYRLTAREDAFHRLVAGQPHNIDRCVPGVEDADKESYGPIPAPVSFAMQMIEDLERLGYAGDDMTFKEIGCGTGLMTTALAIMKQSRMKLHGIDWNAVALGVARRTAESLSLADVSFAHEDARRTDLTTHGIFYLHSPFLEGTKREMDFCGNLLREAERRPIVVATLYDVTLPFRIRMDHLNDCDGQNGVALFGMKH